MGNEYGHCDNPMCECEASVYVPVSEDQPGDRTRALCSACEEVYYWGRQYVQACMSDRIRTVLERLDVGGEQSRQFADEIRMLREAIRVKL